MPFEGLARSHSAEFIAAQRARSRSQSRGVNGQQLASGASPTGEPDTYDSRGSPALFISPSPIFAVPKRHEWAGYKERSPSQAAGGSLPRRTLSRISGRSVTTPDPINEAASEDDAAANAAAITQPTRHSSGSSSRTLGADGDDAPESDSQSGNQQSGSKEKDIEKGRKAESDNVQVVAEGEDGGRRPQNKSVSAAEREFNEKFLVKLEGREHLNPHTWNSKYRWFITGLMGLFVLNATFASSGPSQLLPSIITYFGVSQEVGVLTIALFVAGYCVGPLLWGYVTFYCESV